jgi:hypothetical protein
MTRIEVRKRYWRWKDYEKIYDENYEEQEGNEVDGTTGCSTPRTWRHRKRREA